MRVPVPLLEIPLDIRNRQVVALMAQGFNHQAALIVTRPCTPEPAEESLLLSAIIFPLLSGAILTSILYRQL